MNGAKGTVSVLSDGSTRRSPCNFTLENRSVSLLCGLVLAICFGVLLKSVQHLCASPLGPAYNAGRERNSDVTVGQCPSGPASKVSAWKRALLRSTPGKPSWWRRFVSSVFRLVFVHPPLDGAVFRCLRGVPCSLVCPGRSSMGGARSPLPREVPPRPLFLALSLRSFSSTVDGVSASIAAAGVGVVGGK